MTKAEKAGMYMVSSWIHRCACCVLATSCMGAHIEDGGMCLRASYVVPVLVTGGMLACAYAFATQCAVQTQNVMVPNSSMAVHSLTLAM
eukprot:1427340-Rhodomonas_salina.3